LPGPVFRRGSLLFSRFLAADAGKNLACIIIKKIAHNFNPYFHDSIIISGARVVDKKYLLSYNI
jgi:hypothetical protein